MATLADIEALRRQTAAALEDAEISDLEEAASEARKRMKAQERLIAATEAVERNTRPQVYRGEMSIREKSAFISKYGQTEYLQLPFRRP